MPEKSKHTLNLLQHIQLIEQLLNTYTSKRTAKHARANDPINKAPNLTK
jgi:hypothetical protein